MSKAGLDDTAHNRPAVVPFKRRLLSNVEQLSSIVHLSRLICPSAPTICRPLTARNRQQLRQLFYSFLIAAHPAASVAFLKVASRIKSVPDTSAHAVIGSFVEDRRPSIAPVESMVDHTTDISARRSRHRGGSWTGNARTGFACVRASSPCLFNQQDSCPFFQPFPLIAFMKVASREGAKPRS